VAGGGDFQFDCSLYHLFKTHERGYNLAATSEPAKDSGLQVKPSGQNG
jgi:hypothetical protein